MIVKAKISLTVLILLQGIYKGRLPNGGISSMLGNLVDSGAVEKGEIASSLRSSQ